MTPLTYNADRETLPNGKLRTRMVGKWRNYLGAGDTWHPIDLSFRVDSGRASLAGAPYLLDCPRLANQPIRFESTNRYDIWTKQIRNDAPKGITKAYHTADAVQGQITARGVLYRDALPGLNASLLISPHAQKVRMLVEFHSEPPGTGPVLVPFTLDPDGEKPLRSLGGGLTDEPDLRQRQFYDQGLSVGAGRFRGVKLKRPMVWDSGRKRAPVRLRVERVGGQVVCTKVIPRAFFRGATYPVYTDTTSTFYPDPDPETTSVDGYAGVGGVSDTLAAVVASNGNDSSDSTVQAGPSLQADTPAGNFTSCYRCFTGFDTSAIPDSDTVSAATLRLYITGNQNDTGLQELLPTDSAPASDTAIVNSDFELAAGGTQLADGISLTTLLGATGQFHEWDIYGGSLSHINKTGVTNFAWLLSADFNATDPGFADGQYDNPEWYFADNGSNEPELVVEHAGGGGGGNRRRRVLMGA